VSQLKLPSRSGSRTSPATGPLVPLAVAAAVSLLLAGCMPDDKHVLMNDPALPGQYNGSGAVSAPPVKTDWPRLFGSSELGNLADAALAGNFDIAAAAARIVQADAQATLAAASLFPTISGSGDAARRFTPGTQRSRQPPFVSSVGNSFGLGLSASYMVDFWGRNRDLATAGSFNADASRYDRETVALTAQSAVANAYFQMLLAQDRLRLSRQNTATAENVLAAVRTRLQVGTGTALDVAQQESVLANQRAAIPSLEQTLQQARVQLAVLTGQAPGSLRITGGSLDRLVIPRVRPGLPSQLLLRRPDIATAESRLAAAGANVEAARKAFFPSISLSAQTGFESITLANLLRPEALAASMAAGLTQPIFNGYGLQGQLQQAQGRDAELLANYRKTIVDALGDVETALIAMRQTAEHERLRAAVVASARRAYQITEERLREGTIDLVTLLNTQLTLFQAQDNLANTRFQRLQAAVALFQALGGGFTREAPEPAVIAGAERPGGVVR
jgi:multidrug efflux system outer membrane protein